MKRKRTAKFEKVECMECHGMFYTNVLSQHIKKEHNLLEYIEKYGEFRKKFLDYNKRAKENKIVCLVIDSQTKEGTLQVQGTAEFLKQKTPGDPNIKIKPRYLVFRSKDESGKMKVLELNL